MSYLVITISSYFSLQLNNHCRTVELLRGVAEDPSDLIHMLRSRMFRKKVRKIQLAVTAYLNLDHLRVMTIMVFQMTEQVWRLQT
jgi:hypothetical protein